MNKKQLVILAIAAVVVVSGVVVAWIVLGGDNVPTIEEYQNSVIRRRREELRPLDASKAGKSIAEAPAGTYFFAKPELLACGPGQVADMMSRKGILAERENSGCFEIHKAPSRRHGTVYLIGFVPSWDVPGSGEADERTLYPYQCKEARRLLILMLPQNLVQAETRKVALDDGNEVTVLDMVLSPEG